MDDLVAWLTQIWDDEERRAKAQSHWADGWLEPAPRASTGGYVGAPIRPTTEQVLARIAADRQILTLHTGPHECPFWDGNGEYWEDLYCPTTLLLARAHADRPGFRDEWRVTS